MTSFNQLLDKYRKISFSERDKGDRFEHLMQAYLETDPTYANKLKNIWMWNEFPGKNDLGGVDVGIDLVALTVDGDYWAIQCKCFQEDTTIHKADVDKFLSTSSREFKNEELKTVGFASRLWIDTTGKAWGSNAEEAIKNQSPPVSRIGLYNLKEAPVDWGKLEKGIHGEEARTAKKKIFPHIFTVRDTTHEYFKSADRGKLIMACGTGKTIASLKIAEHETKGKGLILFLVPSIALISQTLREWTTQAEEPIDAICICSDPEVSRKKTKNDDSDSFSVVDLALPASTNVAEIVRQFRHVNRKKKTGMTVVFSTYQSIEVISKAQKELAKENKDLEQFDLIICDEAHRTTGVSLAGEDESAFTKVHDNNFLKAKKRLYMTATPRLYSDEAKGKAAQAEAMVWSMDTPEFYGEEIYRIGFGEAVDKDLLTDYKVLILTLSDKDIPPAVQNMITDKNSEINADDASKLIGCINALSKQILGDEGIIKENDPEPMHRAVAFCSSIAISKKITSTFNIATEAYTNSLPADKKEKMVSVASRHIDGTMSAPMRDEMLSWLKDEVENNECRVLTNVRCLSEGVDVPSLDSVMFLSARNSQVDVVQSVGRVMRKAPNKKYGYIIIPVVVPSNVDAASALDDNERYKVVWTVLNALRAHDDRFNATVNKIELNRRRPDNILVGAVEVGYDDHGVPFLKTDSDNTGTDKEISKQLVLQFEQLQNVMFARMVQKVGDKRYWEQWATNVAEIAQRHEERINRLIKENDRYKKEFEKFLIGLQKNINPNITSRDAIEMLSQHLITAPVFEALFQGYSFVKNNPISTAMQSMLNLLEEQALEKETKELEKFYESVRKRAEGIDNSEGKQRIILELYEKYFKTALPKMVDKLGIVYTPVEVVDFIVHSVNDVLKKEFNRNIGDENIHILDPFTGTGTFVTRLLQSGLINKKDLQRKYKHEIHANEIVLLAYYIAAVNIENAFHDASGEKDYTAFEGICLTDTFQLGETDDSKMFSEMFPQNSARVAKQKKAPLRVIMGNPPYSVGQKSGNDNAQNQKYEKLDSRIAKTYAAATDAILQNSLYDAYIKAFRWSTDRLDKNGGIVCFVSNGAWLDGSATEGFRKCLEKEFSSIYVFNLRGNQRTSGELSRKEGGKIFGSGSRTPIAISLLVKNPSVKNDKAEIHYRDIGDYLTREEKLSIVKKLHSVSNEKLEWKTLQPNEHGDWIRQRNEIFDTFIPLEPENKFNSKTNSFFTLQGPAIATGRDAWVYNFSRKGIETKIKELIGFYNEQQQLFTTAKQNNSKIEVENFVDSSNDKISWTRSLRRDVEKSIVHKFYLSELKEATYRPFTKSILYFDKSFIESPGINRQLIRNDSENKVIAISGVGASKEFSTIITDKLTDRQLLSNGQIFPLYFYEKREKQSKTLFDDGGEGDYIRRDGISDFILERAKKQYGKNVSKEDIFYYVYGFLHSPEYREKFANDLKKMLPRLPLVDDVKDFWAFSKAGRKLAELHINYETVPPPPGVLVVHDPLTITDALKALSTQELKYVDYTVEKMRFPRKDQKDSIIYNSRITIDNIPAKAYEYVVNGKSAIEWIMERYQKTTHKESGITNNPNDWAAETGNPRYILDLLLSVINVSVQTVEIVKGLPGVRFEEVSVAENSP